MYSSKEELLEGIKKEGVEYVDIRFCDLPGVMQHFSIPATAFDESVFEDGLAFDGSSVRGFQSIDESDMMLLPDPATARIDPFRKAKTLNIKFFVHDPFTLEPFSRDPRNIARKAEEYLQSTGIADTCNFGAEAEFYLFDSVRFGTDVQHGFYEVDSDEGWWNRDSETNFDGTPEGFAHKSEVLRKHCADVGTDFDAITRSANYNITIGEAARDVQTRLDETRNRLLEHVPEAAVDAEMGAYLGMPQQELRSGRLADVIDELVATRARLREQHGRAADPQREADPQRHPPPHRS